MRIPGRRMLTAPPRRISRELVDLGKRLVERDNRCRVVDLVAQNRHLAVRSMGKSTLFTRYAATADSRVSCACGRMPVW